MFLSGGRFFLEHTRLIGNKAFNAGPGPESHGYGGGLVVYLANVVVRECNFEANTAGGLGGAIYAYGVSSLVVSHSSLVQNTADGTDLLEEVYGLSDMSSGGGIAATTTSGWTRRK